MRRKSKSFDKNDEKLAQRNETRLKSIRSRTPCSVSLAQQWCSVTYHRYQQATKQALTPKGQQPSLPTCFLGGAAAGAGFWGVWYPLETIKTRMQVSRPAGSLGWLEISKTEAGEGHIAFLL